MVLSGNKNLLENSQGSDTLSGTKSVVQDDINVTKSGECGQGDNFHNEIVDQNTCQENIKNTAETVSCEANKTIDDIPSTIESENEKNVENISSVVGEEDKEEEEKEPLEEEEEGEDEKEEEEENTTQTASEEIRKEYVESGSAKESQVQEPQAQDKTNHSSNIMDGSQDGEHFGASNADQETPPAEMTAEQDAPGATNETINMDVEEVNADEDCPKEDEEMTLDGKEKETPGFEMSDKVAEDDLEENLSQDDEVSMNPSEPNANPAEEESSMNVSDGGEGEQSMEGEDQSMDQDMQVEHTDKDGAETMDVSMANVDVHGGGGDESMEVASPNDEDPIAFMNDTEPKDATVEEQMKVNESVEDNAKPEDEMEDGMRNEEEIRESSKQTEDAESAKQTEIEDSITKNNEETEDSNTEKDKTTEETQVSGPENTETSDKPENVENKDDETSEKEKNGKETETVDDGKQAVNDTTCSAETATVDENDTPSQRDSGDKTASDEASGKEKDEEEVEVCIVPDNVLRVVESDSDKQDGKDEKNENEETEARDFDMTHTKSEKPTVIEVAEKPKPSRKSSNAEKKDDDAPFMASIEPVVEYRHSRPQRQAAKRAETQIKELAEEDSSSNEGFGDRLPDDIIEIEPSTQMCVQCCRTALFRSVQSASAHNMDRASILFLVGLVLATIGTLLCFTWSSIFNFIVNKELRLTPTSKSYALWKDTPIPITLDFYFFNWTNPGELLNDDFKPDLVEVGPYRFKEIHEKVNVTWNVNNTVTYWQKRTWFFDPLNSNGTLKDNITTLNVVALSATAVSKFRSSLVQIPLSGALRMTGQKVWVTKTTGELLFEGYSDPILTMAVKMPHLAQAKIPADKFGWFYTRNGSAEYEGAFNMETGAEDISRVGVLRQWKYANRTDFFEAECGQVNGSAAELFSPGVTRDQKLEMFSSDLCRSITFEYAEDTQVNGVPGYKFVLGKRLIDNGTLEPGNWCNCGGQCVPLGTLNVSTCRHGAPAFVSYPHYLDADPYYTDKLKGMRPDANRHRFYLTLEPTTGIPLDVAARLQINLLLQPSNHIAMYNDMPTIFFPMMWFEERATMTPELAASVKLLLMLPVMGLYCSVGLILLGLVMVTMTILPRFLRNERWTLPHHSKRKSDKKQAQVMFAKEQIRPLMPATEQISAYPEGGSLLGSKPAGDSVK